MIKLSKIAVSGLLAATVGGFGLSQAVANDSVSRAELLASMCNTCHGYEGKGVKPNPGIAGEDAADFEDLMKAFASGEEPTSIMDRHAQGYTEAELKMLAEYFSKK